MGVSEESLSSERETALIQLLDDPSPSVQAALLAEFKRLGPDGRRLLQRCAATAVVGQKASASKLLEAIYGPDPSRLFMEFIHGLHYELESGLMMVSRIAYPDCPVAAQRKLLDELAERCQMLIVPPVTPIEQCRVINRVLFHEEGFRGENSPNFRPASSCLGAVLEGRRGTATLLSSIYILVAQRLGLELEPVLVPGRLLVGCFKTEWPVYLDPVMSGRMRNLEEMYALLQGMEVEPAMHHLAPAPVGEVLSMVCGELARSHARAHQLPEAVLFESYLHAFEQVHQQGDEN